MMEKIDYLISTGQKRLPDHRFDTPIDSRKIFIGEAWRTFIGVRRKTDITLSAVQFSIEESLRER